MSGILEPAMAIGLIAPAVMGLAPGRRIRDRLSQKMFQTVVIGPLFAIGRLLIQRTWTPLQEPEMQQVRLSES